MGERGGPQIIPRPERWRAGRVAPWHDANPPDLSLDRIADVLADRPARVLGNPDPERRISAVLVPLYEHDGETWVVLTRRSPALRSHTHQVSFPGGGQDPGDGSPWGTALREAHEEIDLDPALPERIGELDRFVTVGSGSLIHPEVAVLPGRPDLVASEAEVEHILHAPLAELLLPEVFREELWSHAGQERAITFFELVGDTVWGATAAMLRQLLVLATGVSEYPTNRPV